MVATEWEGSGTGRVVGPGPGPVGDVRLWGLGFLREGLGGGMIWRGGAWVLGLSEWRKYLYPCIELDIQFFQ